MSNIKISELIHSVNVLTRGDGIVSKFDLVKVCGLTEYEISRLVNNGNLTKLGRGCYEFTLNKEL